MDFENKLELGVGIYPVSEIARILRLPNYKIHRWIDTYWDGELGKEFEERYSWKTNKSKAVGFHTLIEFYIMMSLSEAGVKTRSILNAHKELSGIYNSPFPFALKEVVNGLKTDGSKIFFKAKDDIVTLDGSKQLNLNFLKLFFKKLDFDLNNVASKYWPLGKEKKIVVDPKRKFGHPLINGSNIYPETIYNLYKGDESIEYIAHLYNLSEKEIKDAIEYCQAA
jgi:uncharacterized protein (DUF433 family)